MTISVFASGMHIDDNGNLVLDADEMDAAGVGVVEFIEGTPEAQIAELEARLAEAERQRDYERTWKEANASQAELLAQTVEKLGAAKTAAEARAEAAEKKAEGWRKESESHRARATHLENSRDRYEADAGRLRAALEMVETYMASEDGPIYRLWENCDIGDYDDYQTDWEQTLFDLRDWKSGCVPAASVGGGTEWPEVLLYREILAALSPAATDERADGEKGVKG